MQHLLHSWPDIRVVATEAKVDPGAQAGVAILFPPGWVVGKERILVKHYSIAACVVYQACTVWIVSVYIPPQSTKAFTRHILDSVMSLEDDPVFVGGDFNRRDQHHLQTWDEFLAQSGLTDVDPDFPTYRYQDQESPLDKFLVPSLSLDTTRLFARLHGRYRIDTCHHKEVTLRLKMKPGLRPHPLSEKHQTIPTQVFLDPTATVNDEQSLSRQGALHTLKRRVSLAQETRPDSASLSQHCRAIVRSWWRSHSCHFKRISPLKRLYKLLGKGQVLIHLSKGELHQLYEQSGYPDLLQQWHEQQGSCLIPAAIVAIALQAAEAATAANMVLPFGYENVDPIQRARRQRLFWDRLKTICPRGTFYHGPLLQHIMDRNVVQRLNVMKPCSPPETSGFVTLLNTTRLGMKHFRLTDGVPPLGRQYRSLRPRTVLSIHCKLKTQPRAQMDYHMPFGGSFLSKQLKCCTMTSATCCRAPFHHPHRLGFGFLKPSKGPLRTSSDHWGCLTP